jgi:hypothetical protein
MKAPNSTPFGLRLRPERHNEPVAQLCPPCTEKVHSGRSVGVGRLRPAVKRATKGRYLSVLMEDRGER